MNELKAPKEQTEEEKAAQFSETVDAYADRAIAKDNEKSLKELTERLMKDPSNPKLLEQLKLAIAATKDDAKKEDTLGARQAEEDEKKAALKTATSELKDMKDGK